MRRARVVSSLIAAALFGCTDVTAPRQPEAVDHLVRTQGALLASVNTHFMFLPPMVSSSTAAGTFDPDVSPRVEICEMPGQACIGDPLAVFTTTSGPGSETVRVSLSDESYVVNWHTDRFALGAGKVYRVRVFVEDALVGFANALAYSDNVAAKGIDPSQFIPLKIGRTLPIKFRIEKGLLVAIAVAPNPAIIVVGKSASLSGTLTDAHGQAASDQSVAWTTSNAAVATVNANGVVNGMSTGNATVTATAGLVSAATQVIVIPPPVAVVSVTPSSATLVINKTVKLVASPADADGNALLGRAVSWTSSDATIATVDAAGLVTAVAPGPVTITASSEGKSGTSQVSVMPDAIASVAVSPSSMTISSNEHVQLSATIRDGSGNVVSGPAVAWSSANAAVATVDASGGVTGDQAGTATIMATVNGVTGTAQITVAACSNACAVRLSGHVAFSDGRTAAGVTVILSGVTPQPSTITDPQGNYSLAVAAASYSIDVAFNAGGVSTQGRNVAPSFALNVNTVRNLVVPTVALRGRVVDDLGTPVPGVVFHAGAFAQNSCCGGNDWITLTSGVDGTFSANILPNSYFIQMSLTPPVGSPYATTGLSNATWNADVTQDFVIQRHMLVSGIVRYPDGTVAPGATVIAMSSLGTQTSAATDVQGRYRLTVTPGMYTLDVAFSADGVSTQGRTVASLFQVDQSVVRDLTLPTVRLSGRVVDDQGTPVPGVVFHAGAFAQNSCCGGNDWITLTSGVDGTFSANILPNNYSLQMSLTPPAGSPYVTTGLPSVTWNADIAQDFVIQRNRLVSGIVRYSDGTVAPGATVIAISSLGTQTSAIADAQGRYSLTVPSGTYSLDAAYSATGFSTQGRSVATQLHVNQDLGLDLTIPTVTWSGTVVDGDGRPVSGVTLSAIADAQNNCCGGFDNVRAVTDAYGRFSVQILPNNYQQIYLKAPANSIYVDTPLPNQTINTNMDQSFVIVRKP